MISGLRNRGKTRADVDDRRKAVEDYFRSSLSGVSAYGFDPMLAKKNIEHMIGATSMPMATTEGALLARVNRGRAALTAARGASVVVIKDEITRAPVFRVQNLQHGQKVREMAQLVVG